MEMVKYFVVFFGGGLTMKDFGHSGHWCRFFLGEGAETDDGEEGDEEEEEEGDPGAPPPGVDSVVEEEEEVFSG